MVLILNILYTITQICFYHILKVPVLSSWYNSVLYLTVVVLQNATDGNGVSRLEV